MTLCRHCHQPQSHRRHDPRDGEFHPFEGGKEEMGTLAQPVYGSMGPEDFGGTDEESHYMGQTSAAKLRQEITEAEPTPSQTIGSGRVRTNSAPEEDDSGLVVGAGPTENAGIYYKPLAMTGGVIGEVRRVLNAASYNYRKAVEECDAAIARAEKAENELQRLATGILEFDGYGSKDDGNIATHEAVDKTFEIFDELALEKTRSAEQLETAQAVCNRRQIELLETHPRLLAALTRVSELESRLHEKQVAYTAVYEKWQGAERRADKHAANNAVLRHMNDELQIERDGLVEKLNELYAKGARKL